MLNRTRKKKLELSVYGKVLASTLLDSLKSLPTSPIAHSHRFPYIVTPFVVYDRDPVLVSSTFPVYPGMRPEVYIPNKLYGSRFGSFIVTCAERQQDSSSLAVLANTRKHTASPCPLPRICPTVRRRHFIKTQETKTNRKQKLFHGEDMV